MKLKNNDDRRDNKAMTGQQDRQHSSTTGRTGRSAKARLSDEELEGGLDELTPESQAKKRSGNQASVSNH